MACWVKRLCMKRVRRIDCSPWGRRAGREETWLEGGTIRPCSQVQIRISTSLFIAKTLTWTVDTGECWNVTHPFGSSWYISKLNKSPTVYPVHVSKLPAYRIKNFKIIRSRRKFFKRSLNERRTIGVLQRDQHAAPSFSFLFCRPLCLSDQEPLIQSGSTAIKQ